MYTSAQRIRIYKRDELPDMPKLEVSKLGRPWHKLPKLLNDNFDMLDARLSIYFLKKARVNVTLKSMSFAIEQQYKQAQIFSTAYGNIAFVMDRTLLLHILHDYYGLEKPDNMTAADNSQPVTKTEERLKAKLGQELTQILINKETFGEELTFKNDYSAVVSQWSWCITFRLNGYDHGSFTLLFDSPHVDHMLARLRAPENDTSNPQQPPIPGQIERLFYNLPLKLNGRLASLNLTLAQLAGIQAGDIIPISLNEPVPLFIGKDPLLEASVAEDGGKLVLCNFHDRTHESHYE